MQRVQEARRADWTGPTRPSGRSRACCKGRNCRLAVRPGRHPDDHRCAPDHRRPPRAAGQTTYFLGSPENGASDLGCDRLTFTTTAPAMPLAALDSTDDFETQQARAGRSAAWRKSRSARRRSATRRARRACSSASSGPATPTRPRAASSPIWTRRSRASGSSSGTGGNGSRPGTPTNPPRLPPAVRVSYTLRGQPDSDVQVFVVPIPASDVDAQTPQAGGQTRPCRK